MCCRAELRCCQCLLFRLTWARVSVAPHHNALGFHVAARSRVQSSLSTSTTCYWDNAVQKLKFPLVVNVIDYYYVLQEV
jgi:hypothetical protein